jgi:ferrochelatase
VRPQSGHDLPTLGAVAGIDSILFVSFGGPEKPEDVMPFIRNVTRGRDIPEERLQLVADQYRVTGGRSPINDQTRSLIEALRGELDAHDIDLPIYWGNRNWHPHLDDAVARLVADGKRHAVAFVTSAYSSYSSCRQYKENIGDAIAALPVTSHRPVIEKVGQFHHLPGFVDPFVDSTRVALESLPDGAVLVFTAHSIPMSMAEHCRYESQLRWTAATIAGRVAPGARWDLVYQSRSGSPRTPWLEPDVNDHLRSLHDTGVTSAVIVPIGFISDHQEVIFDLDITAAKTAADLGMEIRRAATPGTDPRFVSMIREMVQSHLDGRPTTLCLGDFCCTTAR